MSILHARSFIVLNLDRLSIVMSALLTVVISLRLFKEDIITDLSKVYWYS